MKKRTLVTVAVIFLLATLAGYTHVAAGTPAPLAPPPAPIPIFPTAAVPLTTEQTALVVEPGQWRQLTLWLNAGDSVEGRITVVPQNINITLAPQDISFVIKDPDGQLILNAGLVTDKSFAFVAATPGPYQLVFANLLNLVFNKVISVQVRHPGAAQFPYFAGTYVAVSPLEVKTLTVPLTANQRLEGSFQVQGGPRDLLFWVNNSSNNNIVPAVKVYGSRTFTFTAPAGGAYHLFFDNTFSGTTTKLVSLELTTPPGDCWNWWAAAARLTFTASPAGAAAGSPFATQPVVTLQDASGNTVTTSSAEVTLVITPAANLGAAALVGTTTVNAVNGVATFSGLSINIPGTYTLTATSIDQYVTVISGLTPTLGPTASGGLISATSNSFTVSPRTATKLAFTTSPAGATAGSPFATQPVVILLDPDGNLMPASSVSLDPNGNLIPVYFAMVTVAITPGTGTAGAMLSGTTTVSDFAGVATFSRLAIDLVGKGYTLTATSSGLTSANSSAFSVTPAPVTSIALDPGWNLISLPLIPGDPAITSVLDTILSKVISVWHYDVASAMWLNYVPALGGTLTTMTEGKAYWINMSVSAILGVSSLELPPSPAVPPTYSVAAGWNMIGFKSMVAKSVGTYLAGTSYRLPIYGYARATYSLVSSSTDSLRPGRGYWVYFNAAGVITP